MFAVLLTAVLCVGAQQAATAAAVVRAVDHGDAIMPCGSSKIFLDGPDAFVSWVKNDSRVLYRFPTNESNRDETSFNELCYQSPDMKLCHERTSLFLPNVTKDDSGFYRCRIHYNASPLVDFDYVLTIVDKPGYPKILYNNKSVDNVIGPVALGTNVTLLCEVEDANESSVVQWEHNGQRVTGSELVEPGLHRAVLNLKAVQRDQNGAKYVCITQPADVTPPLTKEVEIKMFLPPRSIKIDLNENYHFESGIPRVIDCVIKGFVPTPTVEWYLGDTKLKAETHQEIPNNDVVISTLTLVVKQSDNNRLLSCTAGNEHFGEVFSNNVRLQVGIKPKCVVNAKHIIEIKPNVIEKAICVVDSDPPPISFTWNFPNNKIVDTPVQVTDIPTRFKTVLSWIPKIDDIGKLNCTATNYYGEQEEPCQFDIEQSDCTDEKGAKVLCEEGLGDTYRRVKKKNNFAPAEKVQTDDILKDIIDSHDVDAMNYNTGKNAMKTGVVVEREIIKDNIPWWVPASLFLLGSLFMVGILLYSLGHWIMVQCQDCQNYEEALAYYTNRHRSSSSFQGTASFHREPNVTEQLAASSLVITPAAALASTLGNCDENTVCCYDSYYV